MPHAPDLFSQYRCLSAHPNLARRPGGWVYRGQFVPDYITVGGMSIAISTRALESCRGHGVDIGAGLWPLPGAIPVDVERGPGASRSLSEFPDESLDYVFSSHCLEHIEDWRGALAEWAQKVRVGGIMFLYLPHPNFAAWLPGSPFVGDGHKWSPTPEVVAQTLEDLGCVVKDQEDGPDMMQSFYVCATRS